MTVHTPGPWEWHDDRFWGGKSGLFNDRGEPVCVPNCSNDGDTGAAWFDEMLTDDDARLIAAAPDLLAACRAFIESENQCDINLSFVIAQAAIAKSGFSPRSNASEVCDMKDGPCACGAWHKVV